MKLSKLVLAALVLGLAGCATTGEKPLVTPKTCVGIMEVSTMNRTYSVDLKAVKANKYGETFYQVKGYNPFVGGAGWVREDAFQSVICDE